VQVPHGLQGFRFRWEETGSVQETPEKGNSGGGDGSWAPTCADGDGVGGLSLLRLRA